MLITPISYGSNYVQASTPAKSLTKADYDNDVKALKKFRDVLEKETKTIGKSKMDDQTKQDMIRQMGNQMRVVDNKIQNITFAKQQRIPNQATDSYSNNIQSVDGDTSQEAEPTLLYYRVSLWS